MFVFSRKFVSLLVVMMLVFGGGRSVKGLQCWRCNKGGKTPVCDADHSGEAIDCDETTSVCALEEVAGTPNFKKFCESIASSFGLMGCHKVGSQIRKNWVCYCKTDLCNQDKNYGMADISKPGSGNAGDKSGSVGTKWTVSTISVLCGLALVMIYRN